MCGTLFARRAKLLVDLVRMGKPAERFDEVPTRVRNEAEIVLGQRKLLQRLVPGLIHAAIFWGFLVLFPTIVIAMIGAVDRDATLPWLGHQGWFALLVDVFAVLVLAGVIGAAIIRKVQRPARFEGSHLGEADLILAMIAGIVDDAAALARVADRARAERVAGVVVAGVRCALRPLRGW